MRTKDLRSLDSTLTIASIVAMIYGACCCFCVYERTYTHFRLSLFGATPVAGFRFEPFPLTIGCARLNGYFRTIGGDPSPPLHSLPRFISPVLPGCVLRIICLFRSPHTSCPARQPFPASVCVSPPRRVSTVSGNVGNVDAIRFSAARIFPWKHRKERRRQRRRRGWQRRHLSASCTCARGRLSTISRSQGAPDRKSTRVGARARRNARKENGGWGKRRRRRRRCRFYGLAFASELPMFRAIALATTRVFFFSFNLLGRSPPPRLSVRGSCGKSRFRTLYN